MTVIFRLEEAAFTYPQEGHGIPPLSLEINAGESVLLCGPSGSGKSTLARCLSGLIPHLYQGAFSGRVYVNGEPTDAQPLWRLTEQVGLVFQNPASQMLASSVEEEVFFGLENLGLERAEIRRRTSEMLAAFDLDAFRQRNPASLSGGEQQKLALASILARRPQALVLDEPLSMLDSSAAFELVDRLEALCAAGATVVVGEHRREFLPPAAGWRSLALGNGRVSSAEFAAVSDPAPTPPGYEEVAPFSLQASGLTITLGNRQVIHDLNLELPGGQVVALIGRNGAGKTTLLRALAGLQEFEGTLALQTSSGTQPPKLALVFQNPDLQLFNASVRDEILYRLEAARTETYAWLLEMLDLQRYENTPPLLLSEGEKRRLALAMVLMRRPQHGLLLDEPSLGQDSRHKDILARTLRAVAATGRLVVIATHDLELAAQADQILLLSPEGILARGPARQIFADRGAWYSLGLRVPSWIHAPLRPAVSAGGEVC